jgi:hypothetical protein
VRSMHDAVDARRVALPAPKWARSTRRSSCSSSSSASAAGPTPTRARSSCARARVRGGGGRSTPLFFVESS